MFEFDFSCHFPCAYGEFGHGFVSFAGAGFSAGFDVLMFFVSEVVDDFEGFGGGGGA